MPESVDPFIHADLRPDLVAIANSVPAPDPDASLEEVLASLAPRFGDLAHLGLGDHQAAVGDGVLGQCEEVASKVLDGETVLLNVRTGAYFGLNRSGTAVWERLADGATLVEAANRLVERFSITPERATDDSARLLARLISADLVERR